MLITNAQNVKWLGIICQISYLSQHRRVLVEKFQALREYCCLYSTHPSLGCLRDSGKATHINAHKLPFQNVKIKSGFLFWGMCLENVNPFMKVELALSEKVLMSLNAIQAIETISHDPFQFPVPPSVVGDIQVNTHTLKSKKQKIEQTKEKTSIFG